MFRTTLKAIAAPVLALWALGLAAPAAYGEQYALLAAVWEYEQKDLILAAPQNDLVLMQALLDPARYDPTAVTALANPTKAELVAALESIGDRLGPTDSLLFYFSGHGTRIIDRFGPDPGDEARGKYPDLDDEALLPADADLSRPETYLLDDELGALLTRMRTRDIACIIDTCYSGDILKAPRLGPSKGAAGGGARRGQLAPRPQDVLDEATEFAILMAAAPHNQVVHELRIPVAGRTLPVSALTYSIYRQLGQAVQADHEEWNLPWAPVLEGPPRRFDEPTPWRAAPIPAEEAISLRSLGARPFDTTRTRVVALGGGDVNLGRLRAGSVRRAAIVIGIDEYSAPFSTLRYAGADAKAMKEVLQDAGFMVTLMTPDSLLQPTRQNIIDQLEWHSRLDGLDMLAVYLSGHGEDVDGEGYFVPMDAKEPLRDTAIGVSELFELLRRSQAARRFVMVDACRVSPKGAFVSSLVRQGGETDIVFTACDEGQWAPEVPELGHGLFTHFLLAGLRDDVNGVPGAASADGDVTVLGLLDYVMRGIDDWYASVPADQRPPQQVTPRLLYDGRYISLLERGSGGDAGIVRDGPGTPVVTDVSRSRGDREPFMLSGLPGLSMPTPSDGDVSATFSVNILAGYLRDVRGLEVGYGLNRIRENVYGAQFAGLANAVGGQVTGFQSAGVANYVEGRVGGFQSAGVANVARGGMNAVQAAGVLNLLEGADSQGTQLAGVANVSSGLLRGAQISGVVNFAEGIAGAQLGLVNVGGSVRGAQVGLVNVAGTMSGFQAGLINVADEFEGVPLGLINYAGNGRWDLELSGDETFPLTVGLRTGTDRFYSILAVAGNSESTTERWAPAVGFGARIPVGRHGVNIDLLHYKLNEGEAWTDELHMLSKLRLTFGARLHDQVSVFAGVTGNVVVSRLNDGSHLGFSGRSVYARKEGDTWIRIWPGFVAGVTF